MTDALAARANLLLTRRNDFAGSIADYDKLINLGVNLDQSYYHRGQRRAFVTFRARSPITPRFLELPRATLQTISPLYKGVAYSTRGTRGWPERF